LRFEKNLALLQSFIPEHDADRYAAPKRAQWSRPTLKIELAIVISSRQALPTMTSLAISAESIPIYVRSTPRPAAAKMNAIRTGCAAHIATDGSPGTLLTTHNIPV